MRRLYIRLNKLIGRHVLARDCWCDPEVIYVPAIRPTGEPS
jgi:hypothetical protein